MNFEDLIKVKPIENKQELDKLINEYLSLIDTKNSKNDTDEEILKKEKNKRKAQEIRPRLMEGIPITNFKLVDKIIELIAKFLKVNNFDEELFSKMMKNTKFTIVDFRVFIDPKGLAYSVGKTISFNSSICQFDENGNFKDVNSEYVELLSHIIFHEMFHRISSFRDDIGEVNAKDTALSEGFTDFFAEMLSGNNGPNRSKTYQFSKDVCNMFYVILGTDKALDDYINNLMKYPNLKELFAQYGLDFKQFVILFDRALNMRYRKENIDKIIALENEILTTLRDCLFIPFMNNHPEMAEEIKNKFNNLFEERKLVINEEKMI